jgi:hypothetical protein
VCGVSCGFRTETLVREFNEKGDGGLTGDSRIYSDPIGIIWTPQQIQPKGCQVLWGGSFFSLREH